MRVAAGLAVTLLLSGCADLSGQFMVLHLYGTVSVVQADAGPRPCCCHLDVPDTSIDAMAQGLTVPAQVPREVLDRMDMLVWQAVDTRFPQEMCAAYTTFRPIHGNGTLGVQVGARHLQWLVAATGSGILVNGTFHGGGEQWSVAVDDWSGQPPIHWNGTLTFEVLGPWTKEGIRSRSAESGFGEPTPASGYWQPRTWKRD